MYKAIKVIYTLKVISNTNLLTVCSTVIFSPVLLLKPCMFNYLSLQTTETRQYLTLTYYIIIPCSTIHTSFSLHAYWFSLNPIPVNILKYINNHYLPEHYVYNQPVC